MFKTLDCKSLNWNENADVSGIREEIERKILIFSHYDTNDFKIIFGLRDVINFYH